MMMENKQMAMNLEATKQQIEQLQAETQKLSSAHACLKYVQEAIYGEIQALGDTMRPLYDKLVPLHKAVVPLHVMQKKLQDNAKALKVIHVAITMIHELGTKHMSVPT